MKEIAEQYENWPYPNISYFARVPKEQLWQINYSWVASKCGQPSQVPRPDIWIAGCGTFQPYVFSQANPSAKILATDISRASLEIAKKRCHLHRNKNIHFQQLDLAKTEEFPQQKFDFIECYGVLMCLPDPASTLKALAARLKPSGVLRVMGYPHYGRQRIFQIQRLAKLLGFTHSDQAAPLRLLEIMKGLPKDHPLRYAFFSYGDSRTEEGIVDAFLHAGDRSFTGIEIGRLLDEAGLDLGFCMHRPWGQPRLMAERLGLLEHDPALWLHYLDLWQSLRTNFILCTVPKEREGNEKSSANRHPLFSLDNKALKARDKARLLRMALFGTTLESRTHEKPIDLNAKAVRRLISGNLETLSAEEEIFPRYSEPVLGPFFAGTSKAISPNFHFVPRLGLEVPNPLYAHLFDAFVFHTQWNPLLNEPIAPLEEQIKTWRKYANPMEDETYPFGLTPFGTYEAFPEKVSRLASEFIPLKRSSFQNVRLEKESEKFSQVIKFLLQNKIKIPREEHLLRELWFLLFSYPELCVNFS